MSLVMKFRDNVFSVGFNEYLTPDDDTGLRFQILQMDANSEETILSNEYETALLVIEGNGTLRYGDQSVKFDRNNWIEQNPVAAHFPAGDEIRIMTEEDSRLAVISTLNGSRFDGKIYLPEEVDELGGPELARQLHHVLSRAVWLDDYSVSEIPDRPERPREVAAVTDLRHREQRAQTNPAVFVLRVQFPNRSRSIRNANCVVPEAGRNADVLILARLPVVDRATDVEPRKW